MSDCPDGYRDCPKCHARVPVAQKWCMCIEDPALRAAYVEMKAWSVGRSRSATATAFEIDRECTGGIREP